MPQSAELIWARYDKIQPPKFYLLLYLGSSNNHTYALQAETVPDREVAILRSNLNEVRGLDPTALSEWLRKHMPVSYSNAFKQFETDKLIIKQSYGLKPIKKP